MPPMVTICIPTFRRLGYLKEAVAAARAQSLTDVEVLISDDGDSTDLQRWCESTALVDPRVRYRKNPRNLGLGGNWNECVSAARGQWLVIQGDDDRLHPSFCERLLQLSVPESVVLFSNHSVIDEHGQVLEKESQAWTVRYRRHLLPRGQVQEPARCVWSNSVPMTSALIRADVIKRVGIKTDLNTPEIELFARLASEGARFDHEPAYLAEFRSHAESSTASGLFSERLVRYLEPIAVPETVEETKRAYMISATRDAVDRLLRAGEQARALEVMSSRYYPRSLTDPALLAQAIAARAPIGLGTRAYLLARRLHEARSNWLGRHSS